MQSALTLSKMTDISHLPVHEYLPVPKHQEQEIYATVVEEIETYDCRTQKPHADRIKTYNLFSFYPNEKAAKEALVTEDAEKFYNNPLWNFEDRLETNFKIYKVINGIPSGTTNLLYGIVNNRDNTMRFYKSGSEVIPIIKSKIVDSYYKENIYNLVTVFVGDGTCRNPDYNILPTLVNSGFFVNNDSDNNSDNNSDSYSDYGSDYGG